MTPLQRDILTVLRINPTPLMTAADIASVLNEWGAQTSSLGVGSAASSIGKPLIERKWIYNGRAWMQNPRWVSYMHNPRFGWFSLKKRYYYLRSRKDEAHLGLKQGHQRYLGCPRKYVWPLDTATRAELEKEYPTNGTT